MEIANLVIDILSLLFLVFSVWLIWKTLKTSHDWNRRKTTQEILDKFIVGEIPELNSKIKIDFGCKIYDESIDYSKFIKTISDQNRKEIFDDILVRILNIFEVISIDIKNNVIEEDICYDYLAWFFTAYYRFSFDFIETKKADAKDPRVLINFSGYAKKWLDKKDSELIKTTESLKIEGKTRL
jgi:hypothetical protein